MLVAMDLRRITILGVVLGCSYAYFYQAGGWNQNSRFDLVRAVVEQGTLRIDAYHENTGDKARFGGHFYTDKAPGASFAAVPTVLLVRALMRAAGGATDSPSALMWLSYVAQLAAAALPAVVSALCLFWVSCRLGASEAAAALAALAYGLGTPSWAYAIVFYGHTLSACCLMIALAAAVELRTPGSERRDAVLGLVVGLAAGWAVVTEYPSALPALALALLTLCFARAAGWPRALRVGGALGAGALACAAVLMAYNRAAFGSPFQLGYAYYVDPRVMRSGFFDITAPRLDVMAELLWGWYRGLLPVAPVLIAAPLGFWQLLRSRETRGVGLAVGTSVVAAFLLAAGDVFWNGGWAYGPRHMAYILGFFALGVAPVWTRGGHAVRAGLSALLLAGVASSLVAVSTTVEPPSEVLRPMRELMWPAFRDGDLSLNRQSVLDLRPSLSPDAPRAAWNLGQRLGLDGHASLLPLLAIWGVGAGAWRVTRRPACAGRRPGVTLGA
jgi:hypothetical protein